MLFRSHMAETAWLHVNRARRLMLPTPGRMQATLAEHHAIVAALATGNTEVARSAARLHLGKLITALEPLAAARPDLFSPE